MLPITEIFANRSVYCFSEMRNPLSAILQSADSIVSALEYAQEGEPSKTVELPPDTADEVLEAAQTIILCAQHQKRIVDDVLTMFVCSESLFSFLQSC
jgi:signal transduction histidine kinase